MERELLAVGANGGERPSGRQSKWRRERYGESDLPEKEKIAWRERD